MQLSSLGALQVSVTPHADNHQIMSVDIGCETRVEALHMETQKGETIDQFVMRVKSMLRALWNTEPRKPITQEVKVESKKEDVGWEKEKEILKLGSISHAGKK